MENNPPVTKADLAALELNFLDQLSTLRSLVQSLADLMTGFNADYDRKIADLEQRVSNLEAANGDQG